MVISEKSGGELVMIYKLAMDWIFVYIGRS